jgi:dTMP kinase
MEVPAVRAEERRFYGTGIPRHDPTRLSGKLVVVEGADGSGRSTQMAMLREWLEGEGFATSDVGLARSSLVSGELEQAKLGNVLGRTTLSLFYATDFADQLENRILPALSAGFIVLADRYIYTLMIRDLVRGADPEWLRNLYGMALVPDLVFYLRVAPRQLVERNFRKNAELDFWESGTDIGLSRDRFDSFIRYQTLVQRQFARFSAEYGFHVINGNRSPRWVNRELRRGIADMLAADGDFTDVPDPERFHPIQTPGVLR